MTVAENRYEVMLLDEDNAWATPSDEQEQILPMTAVRNYGVEEGQQQGFQLQQKG